MRSLVFVASVLLSGFACAQDILRPNLQISVDAASGQIRRLDAVRVDASEILTGLLKASCRRGKVSDSVHGEITVSLHDVPVDIGLAEVAGLVHAKASYRDGGCDIGTESDRDRIESFKSDGEDVRMTLEQLMRIAGRSYSMAPEIHGTVTIDFKNIQLEVALEYILRQVDATYRIEAGVYQIIPMREPATGTVESDSLNVRDAIRILLEPFHVSFTVAPEVQGWVDSSLFNLGFKDAFKNILDQCDTTYEVVDGVYRFYRLGQETVGAARPFSLLELRHVEPEFLDTSESSNLIVPIIEIDQADVRESIRMLMKWAQYSYSIAPEVQGSVTLDLRRVTLKVALQNILRQVDATYRIEAGVYQIVSK